MIYSNEECRLLSLIRERKELDRAVYASIDALPQSVKLSADCQFELDIKRCDTM
jgi:hypothetical protein